MFVRKLFAVVLLAGILFSQSAIPSVAAKACDQAQFISDLTVPDGTSFSPEETFTKTWRLMNIGSCTWTESYTLIFFSGEQFGTSASVKLPVEVAPGQMVDVSINMTAPRVSGHYRGYWKLNNPYASGGPFGIGTTGSDPFWVDINILETSAVIYDFVANAPYAQWKSGAGLLPYPGTSGDSRGYSFQLDSPRLENDSVDSLPGLLTVPQNKYNGYIQAAYPEFLVNKGDHLQTLVNCEFGATGCYVTFRVDYINSKGSVKEFWKWKEAYDGRFYRADLDLSPLAGQKVRFILVTLSTGSASGDRAVWGAPRIVRTSAEVPPVAPATLTPLPPLTPTLTPFVTAPVILPSGCDKASFIADITVPDGTLFSPGSAFTKTWRIKNIGSCAWTTSYSLIYYSGEQMGAPTSLNMPSVIGSGQTVDLSLNMTAPASPGEYRGYWILRNSSGTLFGIGTKASMPFWIEINVTGSPTTSTGYGFAANVCSAEWRSGAGVLPCPGVDNDKNGFVIKMDSTKLEDGTLNAAPSLLVAPQNKYNGYIQGFYPTFTIQPGDRFRTTVGCEYGTSCYVSFRLDYMTATGSITNFWTWREQNEGRPNNIDLDLTPLVGRSVRFILTLHANGSAVNDRAVWSAPIIVRTYIVPPTPTPAFTPTPQMNDWLTYTNLEYGFQFKYPKSAQIVNLEANSIGMILPITPGTNLNQKHLQVIAVENLNPCSSWLGRSSILNSSETVVINGISFLKETGGDNAAGQIHQWVAYSTVQANICVVFDFVLHITNPGNYTTPPPTFNEAAEIAVLTDMVSTFAWLGATPTPTFTVTPLVNDWLTYINSNYGFQFRYPPQAQIVNQDFNALKMNLPFAPGTNLVEKYLDMVVAENVTICRSPLATQSMLYSSETVIINGLTFLKETGEDGAVGSLYQWIAYSIAQGSTCISLDFVLHSHNPGVYPTPPPVFDEAAETAVLTNIVSTFAWLPPTPTPTPYLQCTPPVCAIGTSEVYYCSGECPGGCGTTCATYTPTPSAPLADIGPYAVTHVGDNDSLTIYSAAGTANSVVGSFPADAINVMRTGQPAQQTGNSQWVEVRLPDGTGTGWVDSYYLTEYVPRANFCADARITQMIEQLKQSMNQSNGDLFASMVGSKHGAAINYWRDVPPVNYTTVTAKTIFTDTQTYNWGAGPSAGPPQYGTFAQIVQPAMIVVLNSNYQLGCDDPSYASMFVNPWSYTNIHYYSVLKPPTQDIFDWKVWLIGFEYIDGQPYMYGTIHYVWEP